MGLGRHFLQGRVACRKGIPGVGTVCAAEERVRVRQGDERRGGEAKEELLSMQVHAGAQRDTENKDAKSFHRKTDMQSVCKQLTHEGVSSLGMPTFIQRNNRGPGS